MRTRGSADVTQDLTASGSLSAPIGAFSESLTISGEPVATGTAGGGVADHSLLASLDFASAGHTGFASSAELLIASGSLQSDIDTKLENVVEDPTPELGGDLDALGRDITSVGLVTAASGVFSSSEINDPVENGQLTLQGPASRVNLRSTGASNKNLIRFFRTTTDRKWELGLQNAPDELFRFRDGSNQDVLRLHPQSEGGEVEVLDLVTAPSGTFAERVTMASGTEAAPSLVFEGTPQLGLYSESSNQMAFAVNGVERLRISDPFIKATARILVNDGSPNQPQFSFNSNGGTGLYLEAMNVLGVAAGQNPIAAFSGTGDASDGLGVVGKVTADAMCASSGTFTESLTISGVSVARSDIDFQDVYDNSTAPLLVDSGKPLWILGNPLTIPITLLVGGNTEIQSLGFVEIASPRTTISGVFSDSSLSILEEQATISGYNGLYVNVDNTVISGHVHVQDVLPQADNLYDVGDVDNHFRTLFLANPGGNAIEFRSAAGTGSPTEYNFNLGGGSAASTEGGTFTFLMEDNAAAVSTFNEIVFDLGAASLFAGFGNRYSFRSNIGFGFGIATLENIFGQSAGDVFSTISLNHTGAGASQLRFENVTGGMQFDAQGTSTKADMLFDVATGNTIEFNRAGSSSQVQIDSNTNSFFINFDGTTTANNGDGRIFFGSNQSSAINSFLTIATPPTFSYQRTVSNPNSALFLIDTTASVTMNQDQNLMATAWFKEPNIITTGSGLIETATVYIQGSATEAPAGNNWALIVDSGDVRIDDTLTVSGAAGVSGSLDIPYLGSDPTSPNDGSVWINSSDDTLRYRSNGTTFTVTGV